MPNKSELPEWCALLDKMSGEGEIEERDKKEARKEGAS